MSDDAPGPRAAATLVAEPGPVAASLHELPIDERERLALAELEDALVFASEPRTFLEVGERVGLSKERVRQIQEHALDKLRRLMSGDWRPVGEDR